MFNIKIHKQCNNIFFIKCNEIFLIIKLNDKLVEREDKTVYLSIFFQAINSSTHSIL
jgi:hypothetical protein